jgi:1-acyl-sn-glycerol-3-phosphate acyltransferase
VLVIRVLLIALCLALFFLAAVPMRWLCGRESRLARGFARLFCRTMLRLLRIELEASGAPGPGSAPRLVVANHISWIDILALGSLEPLCFLAKREVRNGPSFPPSPR